MECVKHHVYFVVALLESTRTVQVPQDRPRTTNFVFAPRRVWRHFAYYKLFVKAPSLDSIKSDDHRRFYREPAMVPGINLAVPRLRVSGTYKTSGNTEVQWEDGFYGNVKFVPWKDFDIVVSTVYAKVVQLPAQKLVVAGMNLTLLRLHVTGVDDEEERRMDSEKAKGEPRPPGETFTDETSALGVSNYVFMAATALIKKLRGTANLFFKSHLFSSELRKNHDRTLPGLPSPTSVKPDEALVRDAKSQENKVAPVCTYEFKGPCLDICGLGTSFAEDGSNSEPIEGRTTGVWNNLVDINPSQSAGADSRPIASQQTFVCSADELCSFLNTLFPEGSTKKDFEFSSLRKIQRAIAQTLTQGMVSLCGCSFFYTFQFGIAFEVQRLDSDDGRIVVAVSRPFRCNESIGTVAAIVALADYSLTKVETDKKVTSRVRECAKEVSTASHDIGQKSQKKAPSETQTTGVEPKQEGEPSSKKRKTKEDGSVESDGIPTETPGSSASDAERIITEPGCYRSFLDIKSVGSAITASEGNGSCTSIDETIKELFVNNEGVLAVGASGMLLLGVWENAKVVIKSWNRDSDDGLADLRREIQMYNFIQDEFPALLGSVIPKMLLISNPAGKLRFLEHKVVLVTEYVGKDIRRSEDGDLYVGESREMKRVSMEEEAFICEAAMHSLTALHDNDILHGDIALRNLRVECEKDTQNKSGPWRAWWLDLGNARFAKGKKSNLWFRRERRDCRSLFRQKE